MTMKHFDLLDNCIKTEPLSPESSDHLLNHIASPPFITPVSSPAPVTYTSNPSPSLYYSSTGHSPLGYSDTAVSPGVMAAGPSNEMRSALKSSILTKRKARGETALPSSDDGPREYKLTKREIERKEMRKEQNRRAAKKCRMKKKKIQHAATEEMQNAVKENVEMKFEVEKLKEQVNHLQHIISQHEKTQNCKLEPNHNPDSCRVLLPSPHQHILPSPCMTMSESMTNIIISDADMSSHSSNNIPPPPFPCTTHTGISPAPTTNPSPALRASREREQPLPPLYHMALPNQELLSSDDIFLHYPEYSTPVTHTTGLGNGKDYSNPLPPLITTTTATTTITSTPQNLPSWDLNNLSSDLPPDQENSEDLDKLMETFAMSNFEAGEFMKPYSLAEEEEESPKDCGMGVFHKTANGKPRVVRDLNRDFLQSDDKPQHPHPHPQQAAYRKNVPPPLCLASDTLDTVGRWYSEAPASSYLLDPTMSSPIYCVSPNLVQQPLTPVHRTSPGVSSSSSSSSTHPSAPVAAKTPFEDRAIHHMTVHQGLLPPPPPAVIAVTDSNQLPLIDDIFSHHVVPHINDNNNEHNNHSSFQNYIISETNSYPVPPPEMMFTDCCSNYNNNSNNNSNNIISVNISDGEGFSSSGLNSSQLGDSSAFVYQLSPISAVPSPSVASNLSSPGYLQTSPYDLLANTNNSASPRAFDFK